MTKTQSDTKAAEAAAQEAILVAMRKALKVLDLSSFPQITAMIDAVKRERLASSLASAHCPGSA